MGLFVTLRKNVRAVWGLSGKALAVLDDLSLTRCYRTISNDCGESVFIFSFVHPACCTLPGMVRRIDASRGKERTLSLISVDHRGISDRNFEGAVSRWQERCSVIGRKWHEIFSRKWLKSCRMWVRLGS